MRFIWVASLLIGASQLKTKREMQNAKKEAKCPFTKTDIEDAYGPEVSLFLHCHLRGYDRHGEGKYPDQEYYDKYGAPMNKDNSWEEGYHVVEKKLAEYHNLVVDQKLDFPLIAGIGGGVHLYKPIHGEEMDEPWNWTGWIPRQKRWLSQGTFFSNRYFLGLRGNEVQNNLWDYHPHEEEDGEDPNDLEFSQLEPNDRYRGGYWYYRQPFGRYLHIIALKSHEADPVTKVCKRYNYIVHPLAYRASIETIPDNSVDAMQWCIINMAEEGHFGEGKPWGDKCHGMEIFNDFTYYHSYQPLVPQEEPHYNGELAEDLINTLKSKHFYYYWYDTYPLEFGVFLLDSALARGVYYHTMAANDAFYERSSPDVEASDPKGHVHKINQTHHLKRNDEGHVDPRFGVKASKRHEQTDDERRDKMQLDQVSKFFETMPYKEKTVFGYVTLFDPRRALKETVFTEQCGIPCMGLDEAEKITLDYLTKGRYYASTGVFNLFDYDYHSLPYKIFNQPDPEEICHDITDDMDLVFTFLPTTRKNKDMVWRYTIMLQKLDPKSDNVVGLETTHGYFKLDENGTTKLDLRSPKYEKSRVKWLYFTAIKPQNPQHRAWLHAIRGPAFGPPRLHSKLPPLTHSVEGTTRNGNTVKPNSSPIQPTCVPHGKLDFALPKAKKEDDICVYSMQAYPLQQPLNPSKGEVSDKISESSDLIPPRILQSVHGYVDLRQDYPTRLNLSASWDKDAVQGPVLFYIIDGETGEPRPFGNYKPAVFKPKSQE